jgi:tape measure domain-containing protein
MRRLALELDLDSGTYTARMRQASRETEVFQRKIDTTHDSLRRIDKGVNGVTAKLRDFTLIMGNLRSSVENAQFFFTGLISAAVSATSEIERVTFLLRGLSKETSEFGRRMEAQENLEGLIQTAKEAPFSLKALSDTFVKFRAGGLDPTNGSMNALLDAVAAFGGSDELLHRASVAIQQMGGKGVISMEELRQQLGEAVPSAISLMAKGLGKSYFDLVKEISEGKVKAEPALAAMFEQFEIAFGGSAQRMMETFRGRVSQLKTSLTELAMAFTGMDTSGNVQTGSFYDILKGGVASLTETISSEGFRTTVADLGASIGIFTTTVGSFIKSLGQLASFLPVLNNVKEMLMAIALVAIARLGSAAANGIGNFFTKQVNGVRSSVAALQMEGDTRLRNARTTLFAAQAEADATRMSIVSTRTRINELNAEEAEIRQLMAVEQQRLAAANRAIQTGRNANGSFANRGDAERQRTLAVNALADSGRRLNAITAEGNRLQAVSNGLHAQQAGILGRVSVAQAGMRTAMAATNGLMVAGTLAARGLGAALSFFGGPIGIAIMGVAAAFTYLSNEARQAEQAGSNAAAILQELKGAAGQAEAKVDDLATSQREGSEATANAAEQARAGAGAYDTLAQAAANAAEHVKYLTAVQRQQKLEEVREARQELRTALVGQGPLTGAFTTNSAERVANLRERYIREALGDSFARADRYSPNNEIAERARDAAMAAPEGSAARTAYQEYLTYGRAHNENARRYRELGEYENALLGAAGTPTLQRPETPVVPETPSSGGGGGRGGRRTPNDAAEGQLRSMEERVAGINAEIAGAGKEAAKMAYQLDQDPVLRQASEMIRADLMKAAEAMDEANSRMEGFRALEGLRTEAEQQEETVARLNEEIALIAAGSEEAVLQNARYTAGLKEATETASQFNADEATAARNRAANSQREAQQKEKQRDAMLDLNQAVISSGLAAESAWEDFSSGAVESDRELNRYRRSLAQMLSLIPEGSAEWVAMKANMDKALDNFKIERATQSLIEMRNATQEIGRSFLTTGQRAEAEYQAESQRYRQQIEAYAEGTEQRRRAEETYYAWKAAKEQELRARNPIVAMALEWQDSMGALTQATTGWIDTLVNGLAEGEMSWKDFTKSMLAEIAKIIIRAIIAQAILSAIGMIAPNSSASLPGGGTATAGQNGWMGGVDSSWSGAVNQYGFRTPTSRVPGLHSGGIAGGTPTFRRRVDASMFNAAPKFHGGGIAGLKRNEVPAILQRKEGVFTQEQMKALAPVGAGQAAAPNVQVNVINESGQEMTAQQDGGMKFDGRSYILDVVIDAASKPGKMRSALQGVQRG